MLKLIKLDNYKWLSPTVVIDENNNESYVLSRNSKKSLMSMLSIGDYSIDELESMTDDETSQAVREFWSRATKDFFTRHKVYGVLDESESEILSISSVQQAYNFLSMMIEERSKYVHINNHVYSVKEVNGNYLVSYCNLSKLYYESYLLINNVPNLVEKGKYGKLEVLADPDKLLDDKIKELVDNNLPEEVNDQELSALEVINSLERSFYIYTTDGWFKKETLDPLSYNLSNFIFDPFRIVNDLDTPKNIIDKLMSKFEDVGKLDLPYTKKSILAYYRSGVRVNDLLLYIKNVISTVKYLDNFNFVELIYYAIVEYEKLSNKKSFDLEVNNEDIIN